MKLMVEHDMQKVAEEKVSEYVKSNIQEYLEWSMDEEQKNGIPNKYLHLN